MNIIKKLTQDIISANNIVETYNIGKIKVDGNSIKVEAVYTDIPGIDKATALAQFAIHNKKDPMDIIIIIPSYSSNLITLENGRILDMIYGGDSNG